MLLGDFDHLNAELEAMQWRVRYALDNLDSIERRDEVRGRLQSVLFRLDDLCELFEKGN
jgi:hypothetical protein